MIPSRNNPIYNYERPNIDGSYNDESEMRYTANNYDQPGPNEYQSYKYDSDYPTDDQPFYQPNQYQPNVFKPRAYGRQQAPVRYNYR